MNDVNNVLLNLGPEIEDVAQADGLDPAFLAAVALIESGGQALVPGGGNNGVGYFQIDLGGENNPGVTRSEAMDPSQSAFIAGGMLQANLLTATNRFPNFTQAQDLQAAADLYNMGPGKNFKNISGNPATMDWGTENKGKNGIYRSNVLLLMNCFAGLF
jgi:hypothetical protein